MKFYPVDRFFSDAFDDMFDRPFFTGNSSHVMRTDISEKDGYYLLDMELPGVKKEDIHMDLENGYLTVSASRNSNNEEKDQKGNVIRQERYAGTFSRSFYVGDEVTEQDIKASFDNGELKVTFPKEVKTIPE
ncbi:MAG TPA: Hsp20/alpha crystallin family protein, partial [Candidatus Fimiplasma intestinipullorum]|nr:Hsp20/alpha crystallin family protein [Candidatus Fimiplasma intestinipullorum]